MHHDWVVLVDNNDDMVIHFSDGNLPAVVQCLFSAA